MKKEVLDSLESGDDEYWDQVLSSLNVALATNGLQDLVAKWKAIESTLEKVVVPEKTSTVIPSMISDNSKSAIAMQAHERQKGMEDEEEEFINEVTLTPETSKSAFIPRKPRYYNRVKSGYEWHKYNQTHYDEDNPPPKVVQGYKFNLFYPDLIDKHKTPTFVIERASDPDFCIIRFRAGPPYQDIAFKIVNQQWDYGQKNGYKSVFERGILHLYFNFKRHRYRR